MALSDTFLSGAVVLESSSASGGSFMPGIKIVTVARSVPPSPSVMVYVKVSMPSSPLRSESN